MVVKQLLVTLIVERIVLDDRVSKQHRGRDDRLDCWHVTKVIPDARDILVLGCERWRGEGDAGPGNDRRWL